MPQDELRPSIDQRTHPRVPLVLPGLLIVREAENFPCVVTDISESGAGLQYYDQVPKAESVARLLIAEFGTFEGVTIRDNGETRGLRFSPGEAERNQLLIKLTLFVEEGLADVPQGDHLPTEAKLSLVRNTGIKEQCAVQQITLKGVSLTTEQRPPLGELVRLGRMYGRVAQHLSQGVGVNFLSFVDTNPHDDGAPTATNPNRGS